jgi:phosphoribosylformylglycinamidine synthase
MTMQKATGLDLKTLAQARSKPALMYGPLLRKLLAHPTIASKQWIIRQYDHEVQGCTMIKPLVGVKDDGPNDAAVMTPVLGSTRGFALACGLCPHLTERDPREMAKLAVDECLRNLVAVGADPGNVFILDNFCWGNTSKPDQLGSLVLACEGATEAAIAYGAPFISGKDSLNNEYAMGDRTIAIPGTLLISGLAMVDELRLCVTMDLKSSGNLLYVVGVTKDEMGGSHFDLVTGQPITSGRLPRVDLKLAARIHAAVHTAIARETVRACHDLSEGGLAVAAAEMSFAGGLGARIELGRVPAATLALPPPVTLFSESAPRYLVEVSRERAGDFVAAMAGVPHARVGEVTDTGMLECVGPEGDAWLDENVGELKAAWLSAFGS